MKRDRVARANPPEWRAVAGPMFAGLLARAAMIAWTHPLVLSVDESRFWDLATRRMQGTAFLAPLYPFWLAALRLLFGDSVVAIRLATSVLSLISILLVFLLAERLGGAGSGRVPAWVAALSPTLVYADGRLRSEPLLILLLLAFAWFWSDPRSDRIKAMVPAGVLAGAAVLVRPEYLILPAWLLLVAIRRRGSIAAARKTGVLIAATLVVLLPWMIRNHRLFGSWTITTNGGYNFWKSFNPQADGSQVPPADMSLFDGVPEDRFDAVGYGAGTAFIVEHPVRSLLLTPAKLLHLFGPERGLLSDIRQGQIPSRPPGAGLMFAIIENLAWLALLAGGLYALLGPGRGPVKDVAVAILVTLLVTHAVFFGDERFHVPLVPFLCVALPEAWDGSLRARGSLRALGVILTVVVVAWALILARDAARIAALWNG